MGWARFYWLWFRRAIFRTPGVTDGIISLAGTTLVVVAQFWPWLAEVIGAVWWMVILWTLAAVTAVRLLLAPYWIWRDIRGELDGKIGTQRKRVALGGFLTEAENIKMMCQFAVPINEDYLMSWRNRTRAFLTEQMGEEFTAIFDSDAGLLTYALSSADAPERNREIWTWLNNRATRLSGFLGAIPAGAQLG